MSATLNKYYGLTGPAQMREKVLVNNQSSGDIVAALLSAVKVSMPACRAMAKQFKRRTPELTALAVYDFMRKNYIYRKESVKNQTAKTLPRIIADSKRGNTGDCKHYSTTAATILKCLGMPVYFRVIDQTGRWNHIYTVLKYGDRTIIIDGTFPYFNHETSYNKKTDIKV